MKNKKTTRTRIVRIPVHPTGIRSILLQIAALAVVVSVGILSLTGSITPQAVSRSFGAYTRTQNDAGIALFQKNRLSDYRISPYFDYMITADGTGVALTSSANGTLKLPDKQTSTQNIVRQIRAYLGSYDISYAVSADMQTLYETKLDGHTLTVTRTVKGEVPS